MASTHHIPSGVETPEINVPASGLRKYQKNSARRHEKHQKRQRDHHWPQFREGSGTDSLKRARPIEVNAQASLPLPLFQLDSDPIVPADRMHPADGSSRYHEHCEKPDSTRAPFPFPFLALESSPAP